MSKRKASMAPSEGRKRSDGNLDVPNFESRRDSMSRRGSIMTRRMSISDRRYSMAESLQGRSLMSAGRERLNIRFENTYKMEPDEKFPIFKAKTFAEEVMESKLKDKEYNAEECPRLSLDVSDSIKQRIKAQCLPPRFKVVVLVTIGQVQDTQPSVAFTSRCIWNDKLDNYAEATFSSQHLYAVALVYAMYVD